MMTDARKFGILTSTLSLSLGRHHFSSYMYICTVLQYQGPRLSRMPNMYGASSSPEQMLIRWFMTQSARSVSTQRVAAQHKWHETLWSPKVGQRQPLNFFQTCISSTYVADVRYGLWSQNGLKPALPCQLAWVGTVSAWFGSPVHPLWGFFVTIKKKAVRWITLFGRVFESLLFIFSFIIHFPFYSFIISHSSIVLQPPVPYLWTCYCSLLVTHLY